MGTIVDFADNYRIFAQENVTPETVPLTRMMEEVRFETDDNNSYFLAHLDIHPEFLKELEAGTTPKLPLKLPLKLWSFLACQGSGT